MSNGLIQGKLLCVELNCEKWFLDCLEQLYGMRELGHSDASIYLLEDVKGGPGRSLCGWSSDEGGNAQKNQEERCD